MIRSVPPAPEIADDPIADPFAAEVRARGTLPVLDSMRGLAALGVLTTHVGYWSGAYTYRGYGMALARLDIGVAIFFVLSGFLLSRPWFEHRDHLTRPPRTTVYFWHRFLRIYPVYLVAAIAALTLLPRNDDASLGTVLQTLTLTNVYISGEEPAGLSQMWSLSTEVAFYLVLPLLMWVTLSRRRDGAPGRSRLGIVLGAMLVGNVVWIAATIQWLGPEWSRTGNWLPAYLTWFGIGLLLAACTTRLEAGRDDAASSPRVAEALARMGRSPGACWVAALALFAVAATPVAGSYALVAPLAGTAVTKNLLYAASAGLIILPGIFADPASRYVRVFSLRPLRHLGRISYGIFCVHLVVLELVARWRDIELFHGRAFELFALTTVLSIAVAELLYRLVERPSLRWKNRFDRSGSIASPTATPSPANASS